MKKNVINYEICDLIRKSIKVEGEVAEALAEFKIEVYKTPEWRHNDYLFIHTEKNLFFEMSINLDKGIGNYVASEFERIEKANDLLY